MKSMDDLFTFEDKHGNKFRCISGKIFLIPAGTHRERKIGRVYKTDKGTIIYKKYEEEKHIYRKTNAWSIPYEIYNRVDRVWFYSKLYNYRIIKKEVNNLKDFFHFARSGVELKVYIPLKYWKLDLI